MLHVTFPIFLQNLAYQLLALHSKKGKNILYLSLLRQVMCTIFLEATTSPFRCLGVSRPQSPSFSYLNAFWASVVSEKRGGLQQIFTIENPPYLNEKQLERTLQWQYRKKPLLIWNTLIKHQYIIHNK